MSPADKKKVFAHFNANPPADANSIRQLETAVGVRLPVDFYNFLKETDGGEGFVGKAYLILWRAGELLEMNKAYQVAEYAPGFFLFGSNGGGEAFAFDTRAHSKPIVSIPFVGMEAKLARFVAADFEAFLKELFKS